MNRSSRHTRSVDIAAFIRPDCKVMEAVPALYRGPTAQQRMDAQAAKVRLEARQKLADEIRADADQSCWTWHKIEDLIG